MFYFTCAGQYKSRTGQQQTDKPCPSRYNWVPVGMLGYNSERKLYLVKREEFSDINATKPLIGKTYLIYSSNSNVKLVG